MRRLWKRFNQRDWGDVKKLYKRLMLRLKNLPQNVILVAREREIVETKPDGSIEKTGEYTYESEKNTKSAVDLVCRLAYDPKKSVRYLTFDKDRSGHYGLDTRLDDPTFAVFNVVSQATDGGEEYKGQSAKQDNVFVKDSDRVSLPEDSIEKVKEIANGLGEDVQAFVDEILKSYLIPSEDGGEEVLTPETLESNLIPRLEKLKAAQDEEGDEDASSEG